MARPPRVSVFDEPPPEEVTVAPPEYVKPEKPERVSVFVEPPPETVTVAPPGYVKPEKPDRVSVFDPSTVSSFTPFGDLTLSQLVMDYYPLPEAVAEPTPSIEIDWFGTGETVDYPISANFKISFTNPNIGGFSSSIPINDIGELQGIMNDDYRNIVKYTLIGSSTNQPLLTLSGLINMINNLLVSIPEITTDVEPPIEPEPEVTTVDIEPPIEPEVITADLEEAPTEERPVKWIPEPFFSFLNEVFGR